MDPVTQMAEAFELVAKSTSKSIEGLRMTLTLLAAAVAQQPGIDAKSLLATFDAMLEGNSSPDNPTPMVALDVRAVLSKIAAAQGGKPL